MSVDLSRSVRWFAVCTLAALVVVGIAVVAISRQSPRKDEAALGVGDENSRAVAECRVLMEEEARRQSRDAHPPTSVEAVEVTEATVRSSTATEVLLRTSYQVYLKDAVGAIREPVSVRVIARTVKRGTGDWLCRITAPAAPSTSSAVRGPSANDRDQGAIDDCRATLEQGARAEGRKAHPASNIFLVDLTIEDVDSRTTTQVLLTRDYDVFMKGAILGVNRFIVEVRMTAILSRSEDGKWLCGDVRSMVLSDVKR